MLAELSEALEALDPSTRGHAGRVTALADAVARRLGWEGRRLAGLALGGPLHDVGKLAVPDAVLRKAGPLTPSEVAQIRSHPVTGALLIRRLEGMEVALPYVLYHHERWDGRGYPSGRAAVEIPLEARLLAIADAYDAMTSRRPYRLPLEPRAALAEIARCAGSQFDPALAHAFVEVWGPVQTGPWGELARPERAAPG